MDEISKTRNPSSQGGSHCRYEDRDSRVVDCRRKEEVEERRGDVELDKDEEKLEERCSSGRESDHPAARSSSARFFKAIEEATH